MSVADGGGVHRDETGPVVITGSETGSIIYHETAYRSIR